MEKNFHITFIAAGVILEVLGLIGIFLNPRLTWMWALIILGLIGIIIGWLEEKGMKEDKNNKESFEMGSWLKPLLVFVTFLIIFLLGAAFGSYYGQNGGHMKYQRNNMMYGNRLIAPNGYENNMMKTTPQWNDNNGDQMPSANQQGSANAAPTQSPFGQ